MEEGTSLVWRKSKIIMQEGREVQGKSGTGIKMTLYDYSKGFTIELAKGIAANVL